MPDRDMCTDMRTDMSTDMRMDTCVDVRWPRATHCRKALAEAVKRKYRPVYTSALGTPSAMADTEPI